MIKITLFLVLLLFSTPLFAQYVATITASHGDAILERKGKKIQVFVGMQIEEKDRLLTGNDTRLQIIFSDETIISLGKNSNFSIHEYLFEEKQKPVARFSIIGGAMRTITGKIGKIAPQKFSVQTKTATIGIRGTNFTVTVNESGGLEAYCTYGEIKVQINHLDYSVQQGYYLILSKENFVKIKAFSPKELQEMKNQKFGKTKHEQSVISKAEEALSGTKENNKQLDVTINDRTEVTIQDITQESKDTIVNAKTPNSVIANYSMEHALYYGNYATVKNNTLLPNNGDVKLSINFAKESAKLEIGSFEDPHPIATFYFDNVNNNTLKGEQSTNSGSALLMFHGPTGNVVNGGFDYQESQGKSAQGEYSAKTFEALH